MNYPWPGNVRELQNVIERMVNVVHTDELTVDLLPSEVLQTQPRPAAQPEVEMPRDVEKQAIQKLILAGFSKKDIARKMDMSRSTLYRKLEKYNLIS